MQTDFFHSISPSYLTPYEQGNQNQTTTWTECIAFYQQLSAHFPLVLKLIELGQSDSGVPLFAGIVSADGEFDLDVIHEQKRPIFFNNNGIHPGEPEGIDACMALVRDFCVQPARLQALGQTVFLFVPIYNVDGSFNRQNSSRVNQLGPETFGFRGNALHLDLNRDFIKCDSLNARHFNQLLSTWQPDVMVDTHTSNGADYAYTMTLIQTQADKLGAVGDGQLGHFLRDTMLPAIYAQMQERGWETCPYVNPIKDTPDEGIEDFLETPRFSTGYAALHHVIGFMPETHMLKPYADRYQSMRALVESVLDFTVNNAAKIQALRAAAKQASAEQKRWTLTWKADYKQPSTFNFKGYQACYSPSKIGHYTRLSYDRTKPWQKPITYINHFVPDVVVSAPRAYLIPQAWRHIIARLKWNNVALTVIQKDELMQVQAYQIGQISTRALAYEGHQFHDDVEVTLSEQTIQARTGDFLVYLNQPNARYIVETLEPQAHDSFYRWGFFNSVLEKKEHFSDYVFEDTALELLETEPVLKAKFDTWRQANPELLSDQNAVLNFIFEQCARYQEPEWRRYPIYRVM